MPARHADNAPGPWFVDTACIDCGTCVMVAPGLYQAREDHSAVARQPSSAEEVHRAALALKACPVGAIGADPLPREAVRAAQFPDPVLPDVWFCGFADRDSYGAHAWLVRRPEGNLLVDVPRPNAGLFDALDELGGVRWIFLTHRDDVGAHAKVAARFGAERILHAADQDSRTRDVERLLHGADPIEILPGVTAIPVPGHTRGSTALLVGDVLFSGDHLWAAEDVGWASEGVAGGLAAGRSVCWYSWAEQTRSVRRLLDVPFAHVLPGHGRPWHAPPRPPASASHPAPDPRREALEALLGWMER